MKALLAALWLALAFEEYEAGVARQFGRGQESYRPASAAEMDSLRRQVSVYPPAGAMAREDGSFLLDPAPERGWGQLHLRAPRSGWVLEVPHPVADRHTATLALQLFERLPFDALILGGCHRNNRADGRADLAHTEESAFMAWHQALAGPGRVSLQLHGFDARKERTTAMPPEVCFVVADGSGLAPQEGPARRLFERLPWNGRLAGPASPWLMATTNAQRRYMNGGSFVHLELDASLRQSQELETTADRLVEALEPLLNP